MIDLTVVIPTVGRVDQLQRCLVSVAACDPPPAEVVIVDQGTDGGVASLVRELAVPRCRVVSCPGLGIAANVNRGLREAATRMVAITHDDCTVAPDWVGTLSGHLLRHGRGLVTGRVLPAGDPRRTPSVRTDPRPRDHVGVPRYDVLMAANMAAFRTDLLDLGGLDEREGFRRAAEDFDLCYRWTRAGRPVWYRPDAVVWHHDWRDEEGLVRTYQAYARAKGAFYAKYLRQGDRAPWRWIWRGLVGGLRSHVSGLLGRPAWSDHRRPLLVHMPRGLVAGWLEDRRLTQEAGR